MADPQPPPANPIFQVGRQLKELWDKQPKRRRGLAVVVVLAIAGIVAFATFGGATERWTAIEGASPDDAPELYSLLTSRGVPVRMHEGKLEVATDRVDDARAIAAASGLPRSGKGFELFDAASLGQSSFTEQVNYRRALQGELQRSIAALAQVQSARVHIAMGKRSVFKDQDEPASASVALQLHSGQVLSAEQVRGVRQMVAASVEGMKAESVVVVDHHGNLLDASAPGTLDNKAELERTLTARVRAMLERVVGAGKVSVVTTAVVDDRKLSETQEVYDQSNPVLRSESRTVEGDPATTTTGGVAGTRANLPGAPAPASGTGSGNGRLQETKNYEVNRTVRQVTKPEMQLVRLHVAIVVDHKQGADGKPEPRTDKELAELTALARQAAGIDDARGDKIEMRSIAFVGNPELEPVTAPPVSKLDLMEYAPAAAGGALLLIVVAVMLLKRRKKQHERRQTRNLALPAPVAELERALDARPTLQARLVDELEPAAASPALPPGLPIRDRVLDVVRGDAERAAEVLTAWLSEQPKGAKP